MRVQILVMGMVLAVLVIYVVVTMAGMAGLLIVPCVSLIVLRYISVFYC